jgi:AmmeMemoRadiSam system protein B/AmmeMemoRadiSam system protein A
MFGLVLALGVQAACGASSREPEAVRPPAVAGAFYPADAAELTKMVDGFLARASTAPMPDVVALVAPHAGYVFSGGVAAHAYAALKGRKVERVVVIAPSHYEAFPFAAVYDGAAYMTPLGRVPVDRAFAAALAKAGGLVRLSSRGHAASGERGEHALEVQLPFLQRVLGQFQLVPVVMGDQRYETCRALGLALAKLIHGPETLIVASSDLSHYHPYDDAVRIDRKTLNAIQEWDYMSMLRNFEHRIWEACGGGPIVAAMIAAERLGANEARILKYANSGDVTGDRGRVVGYGAVALIRAKATRGAVRQEYTLGKGERAMLLRIARKSVETAVKDSKLYECSPGGFEALAQERGAFVTLRKHGELRGCIGYIEPMKPLCETVRDVAAMAAVRDQRFPPVTVKELNELDYEISVLSPLRRVLDIKQIRVGQDGLVVRRGDQEGLLLPQVAVEEKWDRLQFLDYTCRKAGLEPGAWKDPDTDIFSFTALVFGEHRLQPAPPAPDLRPPSARLFSETQTAEPARH